MPALTDDTSEELRPFDHLGQAMRWMLPASADIADPVLALFHQIGLSVAHGFSPDLLDEDSDADSAALVRPPRRSSTVVGPTSARPPTDGATTWPVAVPGTILLCVLPW